jgi:hypothetical protein
VSSSYLWEFLDIPPGSAATITDSTLQTCSFTPDVVGSYRVRLKTNGGLILSDIQVKIAAITLDFNGATTHRGWRYPAKGELPDEANFNGTNDRGWDPALTEIFEDVRTNGFSGGGGFTAGGDLSGSSSNQTVVGLQTKAVAATAPTDGQVLTYNNGLSQWEPATPSGGGFTAGGDLSGSSSNQTVVGLQTKAVAATAPTDGQVLTYNNGLSQWEPATPSGGGFTAGGDLSGTSTNQEVEGIQANIIGNEPTTPGEFLGVAVSTTPPIPFLQTSIAWDGTHFWVGSNNGCDFSVIYKVNPSDLSAPLATVDIRPATGFSVPTLHYNNGLLIAVPPFQNVALINTTTNAVIGIVSVSGASIMDADSSADGNWLFVAVNDFGLNRYVIKVAIADIIAAYSSPYMLTLGSSIGPAYGGFQHIKFDRTTDTLWATSGTALSLIDQSLLTESVYDTSPTPCYFMNFGFGSTWVSCGGGALRFDQGTFPSTPVAISWACGSYSGDVLTDLGGNVYVIGSEIEKIDPGDNSAIEIHNPFPPTYTNAQGSAAHDFGDFWLPSNNAVVRYSAGSSDFVDSLAGFSGSIVTSVRWISDTVVPLNNTSNYLNHYVVRHGDTCMACDATLGNVYADLPPSPIMGEYHEFKDVNGVSGSANIFIGGNGNQIDGASDYVLNLNFSYLRVRWTGSRWSIV